MSGSHARGDACADLSHQARIEIRSFGGGSVTSARLGENRRFYVGLPPGRYTLVPEPGDPFPSASEQEVVVMTGVMNQIFDPKEGDLARHWVLGMGVYFRQGTAGFVQKDSTMTTYPERYLAATLHGHPHVVVRPVLTDRG